MNLTMMNTRRRSMDVHPPRSRRRSMKSGNESRFSLLAWCRYGLNYLSSGYTKLRTELALQCDQKISIMIMIHVGVDIEQFTAVTAYRCSVGQ